VSSHCESVNSKVKQRLGRYLIFTKGNYECLMSNPYLVLQPIKLIIGFQMFRIDDQVAIPLDPSSLSKSAGLFIDQIIIITFLFQLRQFRHFKIIDILIEFINSIEMLVLTFNEFLEVAILTGNQQDES